MATVIQDKTWYDKAAHDKAEVLFHEKLAKAEANNSADSKTSTPPEFVEILTSIPNNPSKKSKSKKNKHKENDTSNNTNATQEKTANDAGKNSEPQAKKDSNNKDIISYKDAVQKNKDVTEEKKRESPEVIEDIDEKSIDKETTVEKSKEVSGAANLEICEKVNKDNKKNKNNPEKNNEANEKNKNANENVSNKNSKKSKAKEAKERKNKADKKSTNNQEEKSKISEAGPILNQECRPSAGAFPSVSGNLAKEIAKARQHIKESLQCMDSIVAAATNPSTDFASRVVVLEKENNDLRNTVQEIGNMIKKLEIRVKELEGKNCKLESVSKVSSQNSAPKVAPQKPAKKEEDDDVDLFGSDSEGEDAEAAKIREQRLAAYAAKKSKKPVLIAKSNIILDVKPWDDETDMKVMEQEVRKIATDGLLWGAAKLVPLAYGIKKLQISCVVEDDKVSIDWLTETIQELEDYVQSVDIAAFNKV